VREPQDCRTTLRPDQLEQKRWWSVADCAIYFGVSERFVRDSIMREVPTVYLGERTKLLDRNDVFRFLERKKIACEAIL
jgi:hypothetical protein